MPDTTANTENACAPLATYRCEDCGETFEAPAPTTCIDPACEHCASDMTRRIRTAAERDAEFARMDREADERRVALTKRQAA